MCWSLENNDARITRSVGKASTLLQYLFQHLKCTDYTDLPDGMTITITSGPFDMEYFPLRFSDSRHIHCKYHIKNKKKLNTKHIFHSFFHRLVSIVISITYSTSQKFGHTFPRKCVQTFDLYCT